ncbi:NAD(P)-binding protein [Parathielavia appendiculata]|uniref:NAD(P)-binding protein n=1 Tax=Parathielavia appendiculata TaxID=2587402 RepID=A0AAN6U976_9PEZI|nr:NAD(P)-binding protein [Parathielavia appendiculata]
MTFLRKLPAPNRSCLSPRLSLKVWNTPAPHHLRTITTTRDPEGQTRNRVAIVTGAARGIGRAIAHRLAKDGYNITVSDLPSLQYQLNSLVSELTSAGDGKTKVHAQPADVTSPSDVASLINSSASVLGSLDTMVANAGIAQVKPLLDLTPADFSRMFDVNVAGVQNCFQAAAKQMITQKIPEASEIRGKLIAAASIVAFKPFALLGHYSASKWAVRGLCQVYAMELARHKITVNAYAPGIVDTKMWELIDEGLAEREGKEKGEMIRKYSDQLIALGRTSVPEDVARLVSFLGSEDADYITGQTYIVDGGIIFT